MLFAVLRLILPFIRGLNKVYPAKAPGKLHSSAYIFARDNSTCVIIDLADVSRQASLISKS
jgi:hypothetical protein